MKIIVLNNTGRGKTLIASELALYILNEKKYYKSIGNFHLNIFSNKTNELLHEYTQFGFLPHQKILSGKFLLILDDYISVKQLLRNFNSILARLVRKVDIDVIIIAHYYTHIEKETRELFDYIIEVELKNLNKEKNRLTNKSIAKTYWFNPINYTPYNKELKKTKTFYNILECLKPHKYKNVYVNPNYRNGMLYDTFEIVKEALPSTKEKELLKWSNSKTDLEQNIKLLYKSEKKQIEYMKYILNNYHF